MSTRPEAMMLAEKLGLVLPLETRVRFRPIVTAWAGTLLEGSITARLIPNPYGFFPHGRGYYEVSAWCQVGPEARRKTFLVRPQDIEEIVRKASQ